MNLDELEFFNNGSDLWVSDGEEHISLIGTAYNASQAEEMVTQLNNLLCEIYEDCKENDQPSSGRLMGELVTSVRGFCEQAEILELYGLELNRHYNAMRDTAEEIASLEADDSKGENNDQPS